METILNIVFGGLGGAILTVIITYWIFKKEKKEPTGKAYVLLKSIGKILKEPEGEFLISESARSNSEIADHIYRNADGDVIATAFNEDPAIYQKDLAHFFKYGSRFIRLTSQDICGTESQKKTKTRMNEDLYGSRLILAPLGEGYTRIDGMFCKFDDNTYLCFIALRNPENPKDNQGFVFRNGIAKNFFDYYMGLARRGKECV